MSLGQAVVKIRDGTAPQIEEDSIDRPLALEHLLMMLHRYGLRNNEQYNLGIIQAKPSYLLQFGEAPTYIVTLEGPKTKGSKTIWLFAENKAWYPLAQNDFKPSAKSYADALKTPARPQIQPPSTPASSTKGLLHPGLYSPTTPGTRSDAGSDISSLSCRSCGRKFDEQSELAHHVRNHRHRSLSCEHCLRTFLYNKDLRRHIETHRHKDTRMNSRCLVCGKTYTRQDNLRRHHRQDHPNLPPLAPSSVASSHHSRRSRH
jgi:hypothetical protein